MNWRDWLTQVTSAVAAGILLIALSAGAGSIWPSLKQWTLGHQSWAYAILALIAGITIGRFSKLRKSVPSKSGVRLDRVANLFWLGSDLQFARQMADTGLKERAARGLRQACHHSSELGLSGTPAAQQLLDHKVTVERMPPQLSEREKSWIVGQIDSDLTAFSNLMKQYQPDFRADPFGG